MVEIALSLKQTLDAAGALVVHVICVAATAAVVPLMGLVVTPVAYLAVKSRRLEKA